MNTSCRLLLGVFSLFGFSASAFAVLEPLEFTIVMHIEGYGPSERTDFVRFSNHKAAMEDFVIPFEDRGGRLSAELSADFVGGIANHEGFVSNTAHDLIARGHSVNVHADLAGILGAETKASFQRKLDNQKTALETVIGRPVLGVSGICSDLDWVDVAKTAGFVYSTSLVDYCLKSLHPRLVTHAYAHTRACKNAAECHRPYPFIVPANMLPWTTRKGADWTFVYDRGPSLLTLIPPYDLGGPVECLREGRTGETCVEDTADVLIFKNRIEEALHARAEDVQHVLYFVVSIGTHYDSMFVEALAEVVDQFVLDGDLVWKNMDQIYRSAGPRPRPRR